jgi:polyhydroxyalkanoate synthesis regulator phasin
VDPVAPLVVGLAAAVITWLGSTALARRAKSGRPGTLEAEVLFTELRALKDEYKSDLGVARGRITELERRVAELESKLAAKGGR